MTTKETGTILLLDPTAEDQPDEHPMARRLPSLAGVTVGMVDSTKKNSDRFLAILGEELQRSYGVANIVKVRKANANSPAPSALLEEVSAKADALVHAVAD